MEQLKATQGGGNGSEFGLRRALVGGLIEMEITAELKIQLAVKWSWKECHQVCLMFQDKVLEVEKQVTDMVDEGGMVKWRMCQKGERKNSKKNDRARGDTTSGSGSGEMSGLEGFNETKTEKG